MLKRIGRWISRKIETRKIELEKRSIERELFKSGRTLRDQKTDKPATDGVVVDYMDSRMMGQRTVVPMVIRPLGMGRWR